MIYVIISLQSLLEMFLNSRIAFLIVNIYIVFSCISISEKGLPKYIYYLSLSNYGMGFKQNLGKVNSLYTNDLNIHYSIFILLVLEVAILIASALKVKKNGCHIGGNTMIQLINVSKKFKLTRKIYRNRFHLAVSIL